MDATTVELPNPPIYAINAYRGGGTALARVLNYNDVK